MFRHYRVILWELVINNFTNYTSISNAAVSNVMKHLNYKLYYQQLGTAVAQWIRYCATNRKVAGSIPDGVIGIFHLLNPSYRTMALGST